MDTTLDSIAPQSEHAVTDADSVVCDDKNRDEKKGERQTEPDTAIAAADGPLPGVSSTDDSSVDAVAAKVADIGGSTGEPDCAGGEPSAPDSAKEPETMLEGSEKGEGKAGPVENILV
jgi:hypothetical protein